MNLHSTRSLRRRTSTAAVALSLGLALTACGGGDESSDGGDDAVTSSEATSEGASDTPTEDASSAAAVPSEEELASALLTSADLPAGFEIDPEDEDDDDVAFEGTCLEQVGKFSDTAGFDADQDAEVDLVMEDDNGQTGVMSKAEAYTDPAAVASAFTEFTDSLQSCTSVSTTNDDGLTIDLEIAYDDAVDLPGADDQLSIDMTGTIAAGTETFPVAYRYVVGLAGPFVSIIGTFALNGDGGGVLDQTSDLAALQLERVTALG
ncbi:MAG: hypothetical protein JWN84_1802 [Nocardioides sp.]|nr:hypothetical protein [Nocardioides sp.]